MRYFSEIFLIFFLFAGGIFAQTPPAGQRIYLNLQYEDLSSSPWGRATDFGERLKRLTLQALPPRGRFYTVNIVLAEAGTARRFHAEVGKNRLLRITIPHDYAEIESDIASVATLTAWLLLANLGMEPEYAEKIRDSWYVTGLARKALSEMHREGTPFPGYFPAAYTLTSNGILPTLRQVTGTPLRTDDSAPRLIYEEYSELLIELCSRNRLFREGFLVKTIQRTLGSAEADGFQLFAATAGPAILKRNPGLLKQDAEGAEREKELEKWFRNGLERLLMLDLLPASIRKVEEKYRNAIRFQYRSEGSVLTGSPEDFMKQWEKMEHPEKRLSEVMRKLVSLGQIAPPDLSLPLSEIRAALTRFRTDRSEETLLKFRKAEKKFFRAMEQHIAMERLLEDTERSVLPPATRYFATFQVLRDREKDGPSPAGGINALLDESFRKEGEKGK